MHFMRQAISRFHKRGGLPVSGTLLALSVLLSFTASATDFSLSVADIVALKLRLGPGEHDLGVTALRGTLGVLVGEVGRSAPKVSR